MTTIEQRLERLERQNRWLKSGLASLVVVLMAGVLFGFANQQEVPDLIKARQFQVVDKDGLPRLTLMEGPSVGGVIFCRNETGSITLMIGSDDAGHGTIQLATVDGQKVVELGAGDKTTGGMVVTYNGKGMKLVELGQTVSGDGAVTTFDPSGMRGAGMLTAR